jgi:hypothetical protein
MSTLLLEDFSGERAMTLQRVFVHYPERRWTTASPPCTPSAMTVPRGRRGTAMVRRHAPVAYNESVHS